MEKTKAVGLKWIRRASGTTPYWVADEADVKSGFTPRTVNLRALASQPDQLVAACERLQCELKAWRVGSHHDHTRFDGTVGSLLAIYQRHPESPFQELQAASITPYRFYVAKLEQEISHARIDIVNGVDIKRWHRAWSADGKKLAAAQTCRAILMSALSFGVMLRLEGASELLDVLRESSRKLPAPRPRQQIVTAEQVAALRLAAHAAGRPSHALAYALVFETTLRLWDVIGQWRQTPSGAEPAWSGLRWDDVSDDLVLSYVPSKTRVTTAKKIFYPLHNASMVHDELDHWPVEKRIGPVILDESTSAPYLYVTFNNGWQVDRKAAGIPPDVWARDLRASGITEGRASSASSDDIAKVAGHNSKRMSESVYDRSTIEAAERFAESRRLHRERAVETKRAPPSN